MQTFRAAVLLSVCLFGAGISQQLSAAIIGTNPPALPLTAERIAQLPAADQTAWKAYLDRSEKQMQADKAVLDAELREHHLKQATMPPSSHGADKVPLKNSASWYGRAEGLRIADIIVSYQTPAGGWSKNINMTQHPRAPGEHFATDNVSHFLGTQDLDAPHDPNWNYMGTIDNDATVTQLRYLAKVVSALDATKAAPHSASFLKGIDYLLAAQYPNGGWPQVWPLQGGYHDAITFNDNAMNGVLELFQDVAEGKDDYRFVPNQTRSLAAASVERGIKCMLNTQIVVNGQRTVWCQQHDPLTLQPCSARNYEMPSQCSAESALMVMFLMELPHPSPEVVASVRAAAAWLEKTRIHDVIYKSVNGEGRKRITSLGAGPIWARYYEIGTDRPIFGDRDKSIHDDVNEISRERRQGYGWYRDTPKRVLQHYAKWAKAH